MDNGSVNIELRRRHYERNKAAVKRIRPVRVAVGDEYGMTDDDWAKGGSFRAARSIACYIAYKHYGASYSACAVACNYSSAQAASHAFHRAERSPERVLMAKHILSKIKGVRVA